MLDNVKNIEKNFKTVRNLAFATIIGSVLICMVCVVMTFITVRETEEKVYVLSKNDVLRAYASSREQNIESEIKGHVTNFHKSFFGWDPDQDQIVQTVNDAFYLADESAHKLYDTMKDNGFVNLIVGGNIVQRAEVDSISISGTYKEPKFMFWGRLKLLKHKSEIIKSLITSGSIEVVNRTDKNAHGLIIRDLSIIENKEISSKVR